MKVLLITSVYKNPVVGPARFARLLESDKYICTHILTANVDENKTLKSVNITYPWWQRKLKLYFSRGPFCVRVNEIKDNYDFLLYNSSVLVDHERLKLPYMVMVNDEKLTSVKLSFRFDYFRRLLYHTVERKAVQNAEKVIVNSEYLRNEISTKYQVSQDKIFTLYKGISLENKKAKFQDNLSVSNKTIEIVFLKNNFVLGGLTDLISGLELLKEFSFQLTIIGTDQGVEKYISSYPNISFKILGYLSNDDVITAMYNSDILCMPSRFETLGVAVMEGLAVGIPTVTTGVGGLPEVTKNGEYVWECEPRNPKSIAKQIKSCISNPELRKEKSILGKKHVHEKFGFDKVVSRLKTILKS